MSRKKSLQMQIDDIKMEIARLEMELNFYINDMDNNEDASYSDVEWYEDEINTLYCELNLLENEMQVA